MKWTLRAKRLICARGIGLVLCLVIVLALAAANDDPRKGRVTQNPTSGNRYSIEQEVQLGRQAVPDIEKQLKIVPPDRPISKYISKLGQQLAAKAPGYTFPYTFKVVNEKSINAFALPGGPIYVHTGLIEAATEAELAGVMGHEISHVVMRHSTRQASRQMKAQIPLAILGGVLGAGVGGLAGSLAQMGMSLTAGSVFMKYSRDAETEADMVGAQIIYDAGYDPRAMVTFFNKLKAQGGGGSGPSFLASHPDPGNRATEINKILARFPAKQHQDKDSPEFTAAKKSMSAGGTEGPPATGSAKPEIKRVSADKINATNWKTFQHAAYSMTYPANWSLNGNADSTVTVFPVGGVADSTIGYGVMISGFRPRTKGSDLDVAFRELESDIRLSNPELKLFNSPQSTQINGWPARTLDWIGSSAVRENGQPMKERVRLVAIQGKTGLVVYAVCVSPEPDLKAMSPVFDRIVRSLQLR